MQSNDVHSKFAHIKNLRKAQLSLMLRALEWPSETICKRNKDSTRVEVGDIVEHRREARMSEIVKVLDIVQNGSETRF